MKRKGKRLFFFLALPILFGFIFFGCAQEDMIDVQQAPAPIEASPTPLFNNPTVKKRVTSATLLGFIIPDGEDISLYTLKHGFLRTAENLGYPCKLYLAAAGAASVEAVEEASAEGCAGLLVYNPNGVNSAAIARAKELSIPVVVPYHQTDDAAVATNVAADMNGYSEEVALGVAERMVERACKAGKILVYGREPGLIAKGFTEAISTYYPQYNVASFSRTKVLEQDAINELAEHLLWNRDIKGLFCTDADGALIAVRAREKAQKDFRANGAPEKSAAATEATAASPTASSPGATPVPEGLLTSITISVAGYGLTEDSIALMRENDIYAFVAEPYYEASAQSLMLLDRILNGETVPASSKLNMPIVRMATLEKYVLIHNQVLDWFAIGKD